MSGGAEIAIIGLAGRFPKARDVEQLWRHLEEGMECITFSSPEDLLAAGASPALLADPGFVPAQGLLEDADLFDSAFFGFSPRVADMTDPQQRLFLECAWEALENAGYDSSGYGGSIGVYAGSGMSSFLFHLHTSPEAIQLGSLRALLGNDKDFLPACVSYKLDLRGPSVNVGSACSTSLVAVHLACQGLLNGECDMALAGAVKFSTERGYVHQQGGILSPDGHCRVFDARARGTVGGNGIGVVVLKRLADAVADGDTILAVIRGSAVNHDGGAKGSFTAPSAAGQARVIAEALAVAAVDPSTITYIEAHGTGTELGDPIEIEALTQVFRACTEARGFCAIGSIKSNLGHLDTAAGIAGLIKVTLALRSRRIPASLHFERSNPAIDFENSPFFVNDRTRDWDAGEHPRRAGISSFGLGGTNAHVVLEEAPPAEPSGPAGEWHLFPLSARTPAALERVTDRLAEHLRSHPGLHPADVAFTLQVGRKPLRHRRTMVIPDLAKAAQALSARDPELVLTSMDGGGPRPVVFLFPGTGTQFAGMALDLHASQPAFREALDRCAELLRPHLYLDLHRWLEEEAVRAETWWRRIGLWMPGLFATEYALAKLWISWGIEPQAMMGHSLGEYVAACVSGVLSLDDALALVALRGRLLEELPAGAMLDVALPEEAAGGLLDGDLSLAAVDTPSKCVLSGPAQSIQKAQALLAGRGVQGNRLPVDVALHSPAVLPVLGRFRKLVETVRLREPAIPYVSNVTGTWITAAEATDPDYWVRHLRQTVRFSEGIAELLREPNRILLEVGPGRTLSAVASAHPVCGPDRILLSSVPIPRARGADRAVLSTLGRLWLAGAQPDWTAVHRDERRRRVPLPTYPFERQRHWIEGKSPLLGPL